jgi:POT family proton-dependent oligopeptide transporter
MQNPSETNNEDTPGALNLGQATATRIYCAFFIGYYVAPLGFSVLSDSYLGRYKTLLLSLMSVFVSVIRRQHDNADND